MKNNEENWKKRLAEVLAGIEPKLSPDDLFLVFGVLYEAVNEQRQQTLGEVWEAVAEVIEKDSAAITVALSVWEKVKEKLSGDKEP